tara:strand:- start:278 stop:652 length:375 start_codon:yes stop_codon:yes gene_type:complete
MKSILLLLTILLFSTISLSQKVLISKWEKTFEGTFSDHYVLEIYFEKGAESPLTAVMIQNKQPLNYILNIDDRGLFLFYNIYTLNRDMFAEQRIVNEEYQLCFNSGSLCLIRTFVKNDSTIISE